MLIQNDTTNDFMLNFYGGGHYIGVAYLPRGQTVTNNLTWEYWPDMYFSLNTRECIDLVVPFSLAEANKKIPADAYARVKFIIPTPYQVIVDSTNIETIPLQR